MINPYQASQTSSHATAAPSLLPERSVARRMVDAVLIWIGVLLGAHAGVAVDNGFNIQAAVNRGMANPKSTLYFFLPVGTIVIATVAFWMFVRFRRHNRYHVPIGIRFVGGLVIGCATFLVATWLKPQGVLIPLAVLIATSAIYVELESILGRSLFTPRPQHVEFPDTDSDPDRPGAF